MNNTTISRQTFDDAYLSLFRMILMYGDKVGDTRELRNITLNFLNTNAWDGILMNSFRAMSPKYLMGEMYWYLSGSNLLKDIKPHAKFWEKISDDGETSNSAYGYIMLKKFGYDQIQYVIDTLKNDSASRQACIHIKVPSDKPTKDMNCTYALQFMIRNNKLECYTYMRSTDMWLGIVYDVPFFCLIQQMIAKELGVASGRYSHTMASCHIYDRDIQDEWDDTSMTKEIEKLKKKSDLKLWHEVPKYSDLKESNLFKTLKLYHEEVLNNEK